MLRWVSAALVYALVSGCADTGLDAGEGYIDVEGGRVWYRIVGSGKETPLLLLHGGPGFTSHYLAPLAQVAEDRPVIFYDQLGAGRSDRPADESLWRTDRFVAELAQVREALGLEEVFILGHSWGTMLALDYMLTKPDGVEGLILASPAINVRRWADDARALLARLPEATQEIIERHEAAGTYAADEYQEATMEYYRNYVLRVDPWPKAARDSFEQFNAEVYGLMWGPSEFTITGTLGDYDREAALPALDLPVLFTAGRYDEATPETTQYYAGLVPGSRVRIFENSAHLTMLDAPEEYVAAIREFLNEID